MIEKNDKNKGVYMNSLLMACRARGVNAGVISIIESVAHLERGRAFARDYLRLYYMGLYRCGFNTIGEKIKGLHK